MIEYDGTLGQQARESNVERDIEMSPVACQTAPYP